MVRFTKKIQAQKWLPLVLGVSLAVVPVKAYAANLVFENAVAFEAGGWVYDVTVGDVNGDGLDDLVTLNFLANQVSVLLGRGDGTFETARSFNVGNNPRAAVIADLDGDHYADLAVVDMNGNTVSILKGNGDGTFQTAVTVPCGGAFPLGIVAADLNGDGAPDLALANSVSNTVSVLLNTGNGMSFVPGISVPVGMNPRSLEAWDMDGDGSQDLAVANSGSDTVSILKNDGTGTQFSRVDYAAGRTPERMKAADLNGDGRRDMVFAANGDHGVTVLLDVGGGVFGPSVLYPSGNYPLDVALGDFDGDGKIDILSQTQTANFALIRGNGDGTFQSSVGYAYPRNAPYLETGEFNGDGRSDIVFAGNGYSSTTVMVLNSKPEGTLSLGSDKIETPENGGAANVTIKRTGSGSGQAAVRIRTTDGTAVAGKDYAAVDDVIVLQDGETSKDYPIMILDNPVYEGDKTFKIRLSDPANGYVIGKPNEAAVTIREDDAVPDTTPPAVDVSKFGATDNYAGTPDRLYGTAGAVSEAGALVKAYPWTDTDKDGIVNAGELGVPVALGTSDTDGSVPAADVGDLAPGSYAYVITATDAAGNESAKGAGAVLTVTLGKGVSPDTEAPVWPAGGALAFSGVTSAGVNVGWPEAADNTAVAGYDVYKNGVLLTTVSADTYSYKASGLTGDTLYSFAVKVRDAAGNGSAELAGTVRTLAVPASGGSSGSSPSLSAESRLQELRLAAGEKEVQLTPQFQPGVSDYAAVTDAERAVIHYKTMDSAARAVVNGLSAGSADGEYAVSLNEGVHVFKIAVQAEDGSTREYKLTVTHKAAGEGGGSPGTKPEPGTAPGPGTKPEPGKEPGAGAESRFADISGHWAEADIGRAYSLGLIDGYEDGRFLPDASINRAEWIVMLERLLKSVKESATSAALPAFADAGAIPAWAKQAVENAAAKGLVTGYEDGAFRPGAAVTRAELAVMLAKAVNGGPAAEAGKAPAFADEAAIPVWAKPYVQAAAERGLIDGRSGGEFAPGEKATRAEAAVLLVRLAKLLNP